MLSSHVILQVHFFQQQKNPEFETHSQNFLQQNSLLQKLQFQTQLPPIQHKVRNRFISSPAKALEVQMGFRENLVNTIIKSNMTKVTINRLISSPA